MFKAFKQLFSIVLILLLPQLASAQWPRQKAVDSLLALVPKTTVDTAKINLLTKLAYMYHDIDTKKGINFGEQALNAAGKIGYKKGMFNAYNALGANYWAKYDFIKAQDYYGAGLKIAEESGDKLGAAHIFHNIGICYQAEKNFPMALIYYNKLLKIYEETGQKKLACGTLSNMASVYVLQARYNDALDTLRSALKIANQSGDKISIASCYHRIGDVDLLSNRYTDALKYDSLSIQQFSKLKDYENEVDVLGSQGEIYLRLKKYPRAIAKYGDELNLLNEKDNNIPKGMVINGSKAAIYHALGDTYAAWAGLDSNFQFNGSVKHLKYLQLAVSNFELSLAFARLNGYIEDIAATLKSLSEIQSTQRNFKRALETYKEYIVFRDSVSNLQKDREYKQHELAFEYAKKRDSLNYAAKLEREQLQREKVISANKLKQWSLYAIVVIVVLLLIVSYFVFRNRIQKANFNSQLGREKADVELKHALFENKLNDLTLASLKAQMNPHFIFNCLNSIKFYVEKNETEAASLYITKFSKLIRSILDSARSEKIMLSEELELIKLYLEMEGMRLKEKLCHELKVDDNIDGDFIEIPPLLIHPYIENAIWHGIMNKAEGGFVKLKISASPDGNYLVINITDNGVGRKKSAELKSKSILQHTSHGTKLNNERIEIFNAKYKTNTEVIIADLHDANNQACGTSVTIKLLIP